MSARRDWVAVAGDDGASPPYPANGLGTFLRAIDGMRDDFREDMAGLRRDVREDMAKSEERVMGTMAQFARVHGVEHDEDRLALDRDLTTFRAFMHAAEIAQAKRDGALGVLRFVLELVSKHAKPIVAVIGAATVGIAVLLGQIHIEVVAR